MPEDERIIQKDNMMKIELSTTGSFKNIWNFLRKNEQQTKQDDIVQKYAQKGVDILREETPKRTGLTANSWYYEIEKNANGYIVYWLNSNKNRDENIALLIQYGHGTGWGTYVQGKDYINPAMQKVFEEMATEIWEEVTNS